MPGSGISPYPFFRIRMGGSSPTPPPPPFVRAYTNSDFVTEITGLDYVAGSGPSAPSFGFGIWADGLTGSGNVTVFIDSDFEVFDGTIWQSTSFTVPYIAGFVKTGFIYRARLKAGLSANPYVGLVTLAGPGATDWDIDVSGDVAIVPAILDLYPGATVAWSLNRQLRTAYSGDLWTLRRSSDSNTLSIPILDGEADLSGVAAFLGSDDGFLMTISDQSGFAMHLSQPNPLLQFQIATAGALSTTNGKIAVPVAALQVMILNSNITTVPDWYSYSVIERALNTVVPCIQNVGGADYVFLWFSDNVVYTAGDSFFLQSAVNTTTGQKLISVNWTTAVKKQYLNSAELVSSLNALPNSHVVMQLNGTGGKWQEQVFWNLDETANQAGIESNVNVYYNIF